MTDIFIGIILNISGTFGKKVLFKGIILSVLNILGA